MRIGFIGYGEAAYNISLGLRSEGLSEFYAYDVMANHSVLGTQVSERAKQASVELLSNAKIVADKSDLVFSAVPSTNAMSACLEIKDHLRPDLLFVDVCASTPGIKETIWESIKDTGVLFVDAAMLGSLPKDKHRVPIVASGNGAKAFYDSMTSYGMKINLVGDKVGAASAIKLVRSIFMKGIASLMIEMLQAGDKYDVVDQVVNSISESLDSIPFTEHLDRLVIGSALHCSRRAAELNGSIAMLAEGGIASGMTTATKQRLEALESYNFAEQYAVSKPSGWQEIIRLIRPNN